MTPQEIADEVAPLIESIDDFLTKIDLDELKEYQEKIESNTSMAESAMVLTMANPEDIDYRRGTDRFFKAVIEMCDARNEQRMLAIKKARAKGQGQDIMKMFGL